VFACMGPVVHNKRLILLFIKMQVILNFFLADDDELSDDGSVIIF
jgi:hypothetical protein